MSARVAIVHHIEQSFDRPVRLSTHWLRLRPAPETRARVTAYSLELDAEPHFLNWLRDPFENHLARLDLPEPLVRLGITVEVLADLEPVNPFDFLAEPEAAEYPFSYQVQLRKELAPYLNSGEPTPRLQSWFETLDRARTSTVERLTITNQRVHAFAQHPVSGAAGQLDLEALLARGTGTCWELAWLLTLSLRDLGLAARFTCGYRVVLAEPPGAEDGVSLHTWSETFVPGAGWLGLDPSTGLFTDETYIPLACAPDPMLVLPIVGSREVCQETRVESVQLRRLEPAKSNWPYSDTQWADIHALGSYLDSDLKRLGVALGSGMSLSFVSSDPGGAPEWNTLALGPSKRFLAERLLARLQQRLAPGGALQLGQGDWYASEALPRWRLGCYFRADGQSVWRNRALLAGTGSRGSLGSAGVAAFARILARALGVPPSAVIAAYEDPLHDLWSRRLWPPEISGALDLDDAKFRREFAERLSETRASPAGYVLPLAWDRAANRFASGRWVFRRTQLYLVPGDSALGYRLPLGSLIKDEGAMLEAQAERCPFEERGALPDFHIRIDGRQQAPEAPPSDLAAHTPRTAVCLQLRENQLCVFLPPLSHVEHYLELLAAIEAAAEAMAWGVVLEGYEPPEDHRLRRLVLEPDATVLRLHLPETQDWKSRLELLEVAYEEAFRAGLRSDRIGPDGSTIPSGGGGRLTLGGVRPADSPFLRWPDLLRGLVAYFQRHPSLSYFFAGRAIGPSGDAPRPDEGRDEACYELSIGLSCLPPGESFAIWRVDRVLRHLLCNPSGDITHAEIRMDQLYAPERASQRLGRICLHSFELAPHAQIAALQSLLAEGLLGRFARLSDSGELKRWGSALHDRFMLPQELWEDLRDVVQDLNAVGYPFQLEWFEPMMSLRFPVLGEVRIGSITIALRAALEPWPLLAEEVTGAGVTRFIDAANERVQTKVSGLAPGRYVLACNGNTVPLQSTGPHGEYVAGVRYKVANPPSTLHPTIPPVDALIFDLVDTWTARAIGGCTYFPPRPQLWGPVGIPLATEMSPTPGDGFAQPRVAVTPHPSLAQRLHRGRFHPYGSGVGPMSAPPRHTDSRRPYLLDLTQRP